VQSRRVLLWAVMALVAVDLVFFSGASNFLASPQSRILNQVLVFGAMVAFGVAAWRGSVDLRSPLVLPGVAWIVATTLTGLLSLRPAASLEAVALLLLAAPAYLVVRAALAEPWLRERLDWLVIVATTVFVVAYLLQALTQWIAWWSVAGPSVPPLRPGDVGLTVGTVNAVALYLELLAPVAVWLSWTRWRSRRFTIPFGILAVLAIVVTGSRGAWLGALVGGALLALFIWSDAGRPRPARIRQSPIVLAAAAVLIVGAAIVVGPLLLTRLLSGDAGRFELWNAAWSMFTSDPVSGVGPGAWPGLRPLTHISDAVFAVLATSHNSVLQVLAESGLIGAAAAAWLVVAIARVGWRAIQVAPTPAERRLREICLASLLSAAAHSLVDTQFHLPAIVLLTMHLVARLDPAPAVSATSVAARRARPALAAASAVVLVGAALLVPIDLAMIRAQSGNGALDRGDAATAATDFDAAVGLHDLPAYRLGQALARAGLGDATGAAEALARMDAAEPFTFVAAERATLAPASDQGQLLERIEADGPYDATATLAAAILRYPGDPSAAAADLAGVMAAVPTLVYSTRPPALFDDPTWRAAQEQAVERIGTIDPVVASGVAILAGLPDAVATQRSKVPDGPESRALDLLAASMTSGSGDIDAARALLRQNPGSAGVENVLSMLGFHATSQVLIDEVRTVSFAAFYLTPIPPMELVADGRANADWSVRLPRYPQAASGRQGPKRPYLPGMVTIEPVFRPKG
jgi:O-antigen ligase